MTNSLHYQRQTTSSSVSKRHQLSIHTPNNENIENGQIPSLKKRRIMEPSVEKISEPSSSCGQIDDADTAAPSVKELKGWLSGFEKQQKDHYEKNTVVRKRDGGALDKGQAAMQATTNRAKSVSSTSSAENNKSTLLGASVKGQTVTPSKSARIQVGTPSKQQSSYRATGSSGSFFSPPKQYSTSGTRGSTGTAPSLPQPASLAAPGSTPKPIRFKPRVKKDEVQATDEKNASVQKLAEWLQDDPFEQRKLRSIRKGVQVIEKSRAFESETSLVVPKEKDAGTLAQHGSVADRQKWLKSAFKDGDEEEEEEESTVSEKAKWLAKAFKKKGTKPYAMRPYHGTVYDGNESSPDSSSKPVEGGGAPQALTSESGEMQKILPIDAKDQEQGDSHMSSSRSSVDLSSATKSQLVKPKTSSSEGKSETEMGINHSDSSNTVTLSSEACNGTGDRICNCNISMVSEHDAMRDKENSSDNCQIKPRIGYHTESLGHNSSVTENSEEKSSVLKNRSTLGSKEGRGVLGVAAAFGGVTKLSSVQRRRLALEQKSKEMRKKADPRSNMLKTTWESSSSGSIDNGSYAKKMVDHSALVPKKTLSDLP